MKNVELSPPPSPDPEMVLWAGGSRLLASLFQRRGITSREEVEHLLDPLKNPEPDLDQYQPLIDACSRLQAAVDSNTKIAVYGDYDVDGITATTVLVSALEQLGADVMWHIPDRFTEGYGMNGQRVKELAAAGVGLIVTCDCGISNHDEIDLARQLGMEVLVTDHHTPPDRLPAADAVVNFRLLPPGHPSRDLPGVGTAYVVARKLFRQAGLDACGLLDLVALGIIADVVPLTGHNRQLYVQALPHLRQAARPGLASLFAVAKLVPGQVDEEKIAFQIAPRMNAAGRLADGGLAVRMLLAQTQEEARPLAAELDQLNTRRKQLGREMLEQVKPRPDQPLIAYNHQWHQGIIGIVAGQICSSHQIPAVMITKSPGTGLLVGSGRSVEGIDLYQALSRCSQHLESFGGHTAAAGFSLHPDQLEAFTEALEQHLAAEMSHWQPQPLRPELELSCSEITLDLVEELNRLAPCGQGNPRPLLYCTGLAVKDVRAAATGHILSLGDRGKVFSAGLWNQVDVPDVASSVGAAFTLTESQYRGERSVWATIEAWWPEADQPRVKDGALNFVDCRGQGWEQVIEKHPQGMFFREGAGWLDCPGATRMGISANKTLVLLTAPASPGIFRQVLTASGPETVVLAWDPGKENFLEDLLGVVKFVLNKEGGCVELSLLAAALGHCEDTVVAGLELLETSRLVDVQISEGKLVLQRLDGNKLVQGREARRLRRLLEETTAYRRWLQAVAVKELETSGL